jgi:hypothetical protein
MRQPVRETTICYMCADWLTVWLCIYTCVRLQAVSMLPALLLAPRPEHFVVDMCAAGPRTPPYRVPFT